MESTLRGGIGYDFYSLLIIRVLWSGGCDGEGGWGDEGGVVRTFLCTLIAQRHVSMSKVARTHRSACIYNDIQIFACVLSRSQGLS